MNTKYIINSSNSKIEGRINIKQRSIYTVSVLSMAHKIGKLAFMARKAETEDAFSKTAVVSILSGIADEMRNICKAIGIDYWYIVSKKGGKQNGETETPEAV